MRKAWVGVALISAMVGSAQAGQVEIQHARFQRNNDRTWAVQVTLRHHDTGWRHYADAWRVVSMEGKVLATRTLFHPHVDEQPFTRGLGAVRIPDGVQRVRIEAHDKVHGWTPRTIEVDLTRSKGPGFEVLGVR